jgi:hypothetical protein
MTIILDNVTIPEKGTLEINVRRTVEINFTAEYARTKVNHWVMDQVSYLMGAETPALVAGEEVVWRVPVYISFPQVGKAGNIGAVDVDVQTGEMKNTPELQAELEQHALEFAERQPPYKPRSVAPEFIPQNVPQAKKLAIAEDGQLKPLQ